MKTIAVTRGEILALSLALIVFPVLKVHVLVSRPTLETFVQTGARSGWWSFWGSYAGVEVAFTAIAILALAHAGHAMAEVGLTHQPTRGQRAVGLILLAAFALVVVLRHTSTLTIPGRGLEFNVQGASTTAQRVFLLGVVCATTVCEEVLYRGFAISRFELIGLPRFAAVLVPAIAYGYLHTSWTRVGALTGVAALVGAVLLGVVYERTGTLWWPILLHLVLIGGVVALAPVRVPSA